MPLTTAPPEPFTTNTFGRRAGATWVAATGAALVLVAAAVLVASRWDQLSDLFKLGLLAGATASCAWLGNRIKPTLPATGSVVFHLGLLLVPANIAAIAVHLSASLGQHMLSQGVVGAVLYTAAAAATGSVVFRWASISSVPLIAAGVGALTPVPALAVLLVFAAAAEWLPQLRARHAVVVWAGLAGLAPMIVATLLGLAPGRSGHEVVDAIGLHGMTTAWATGLAATVVLAWRAEKDHSLEVAGLAIVSAVAAGASAIASSHLQIDEGLFGVASAFVLVEVLALAVTGDRFWKQPLAFFAGLCELPAWIVSVGFGVLGIVFASVADGDFFRLDREPTLAAALFAAAAGWFVAGLRRERSRGVAFANIGVAVTATAGVVFATASPSISAAALAAFAVGFAVTNRRPLLFGFFASPLALALTAQNRVAAVGVGAALAGSMLFQALTEERREDAGRYLSRTLVLGACGTALLAVWIGIANPFTWSLVAIAIIAAFASVAETAGSELADTCRLWFLLPLATIDSNYQHVFAVSGAVALSLVVDGLRLRRPLLVGCAAVCSQMAVVAACLDSGLTVPQAGIALAFFAVVLTGVAAIVEDIWQRPFVGAAAVAAGFAFYLAATDAQAITIVMLVIGGLGVAAGMTLANDGLSNVGGALIGLGFLLQLSLAHVTGMEFYVLPVAVHLAVAGEIVRRRRPVSSWLSAAPGPALVASAAVLERIAGGSALHALTGAIVAGAAVAIGGSRRQAGPLLSGTAILAVLAGNESLSALAGVPAWGWIGIVGAALIAIAVMIERTDTSPVDVGRRLVDVIGESFD